jgi:hypothetical protein
MAICSNCGQQSSRVRSRWTDKGIQLPDECPQCSPSTFDKFSNPSDKKIWMGYEAHPNEYVRSADGGYDRKPEYRSEQEQRLALPTEDEAEMQAQAEAHKRATRRTEPMSSSEISAALNKARELLQA